MRRDSRRYLREERRPAAAVLGPLVSIAGLMLLLAGPLGYRWELIPLRTALLGMLTWAAYAGLAGAALSLVGLAIALVQRRRGAAVAFAGVVLGLATAAIPYLQVASARGVPPIHDITTDIAEPPLFVAVLPLRASAPNSVEYGGEKIAEQQRRAYPDLTTTRLAVPPDAAFDRAMSAVGELGWAIVAASPADGRLEATDTTFWYGFKDDVVVRIRPTDGGSLVDVRSLSRVGGGDVGTNAARIRAFLAEIQRE